VLLAEDLVQVLVLVLVLVLVPEVEVAAVLAYLSSM
jgi:hypothetical protein